MFVRELRKQKVLFAISDGVALFASFVGALAVHDPSGSMRIRLVTANMVASIPALMLTLTIWLAVFHTIGLYRRRYKGLPEAAILVRGNTVAVLLLSACGFLLHLNVSRITLVIALILSTLTVFVARTALRAVIRRVYAQEAIATPLIIVGFNALSRYICDQIVEEATHYVVLGFLDDTLKEGTSYHNSKILGPTALLSELAAKHSALEVLIVLPEAKNAKQLELIVTCERSRVRWKIVPWPTHVLAPSLETDRVGVIPVLSSRGSNIEGLNYLIKRSFDLVVGVSLLSAALPVIALGALAILMFDGRPIFFCQTRIGIHRQPFRIIKFRTMRRNANEECHRDFVARWIHGDYKRWSDRKEDNTLHKLVADTRITAVGRWLRRFSVDELPQLLNVIRGEMSLIGPRPALPYEVELYQAGDVRRFDAPPGITGLWQVSGRSRLSFQEMIRLDLQYQENWSLAGDIAILLRTVPELLRGGGL